MQTENRVRLRVRERPFLYHERRSPFLPGGRPFLRRLEDELHRAGEVAPDPGQYGGHAEQDGDVIVMATGVHHPDVLPVVKGADFRGEGKVHLFHHRQGVHIRPQGNDGPRFAATEDGDHAGMGDAGPDLEAQGAQMVGDQPGGAGLAVAQLGMFVDVAPPGDDAVVHGGGAVITGASDGKWVM